MTSLSSPVFFSIQHKGYRYPQMCHTNVAIISTISVYAAQFPQSIVIYLKGVPDPGGGSKQAQYEELNIKHTNQIMKASKGDLTLM